MSAELTGLVQALTAGDEAARTAAANQLVAMGPAAAPAVPLLIEALGSQDPQVRAAVAGVIASLGPQAEMAMPALMQALADPNANVQQIVAGALGQFGSQAMQAVPQLIQAMQAGIPGANPKVQAAIAQALAQITGQSFGTDPVLWQQWWDALQAGSQGPLDFAVPSSLDHWERNNGDYRATIVVHITGGSGPFVVHHDLEQFLTAERDFPLVFQVGGCTIVHTIRVDSSDGQTVSHSYYINSPWCK